MGSLKIKIIVAFFIISTVLSLVGALYTDPDKRWILWTIFGVLVFLLVAFGIYMLVKFLKRNKHKESEQELLLKQEKNIINQLFRLSVKSLGRSFTKYRKPLFIMLGSEKNDEHVLLSQNGFRAVLDENSDALHSHSVANTQESDSYLKFWHNDSAMIMQIGNRLFGDYGAENELWQEMIRLLCQYRSQLPCNGIIYTLGCSFVQTGDKDYHDTSMNKVRQALLDFNSMTGTTVPVFLMLTNADSIRDFVPFIKIFELLNQNKPLGFNLKNKDRYHLDFADYDQKTKQIVEYFSQNSVKFFKNLSEEESRSALSFVYELALFFNIMKDCLKTLCHEDKLKKSIWLRGMYFVIPNQRAEKYDLLTQFIAAKNDISTDGESEDLHYDKKRYFVSNLFDDAILPARNITGVNNVKQMSKIMWYIAKISLSVCLLAMIGWWYYTNWQSYISLRSEVKQVLRDYDSDISSIDLTTNNQLDDLIMSLDSLRQMNNKLHSQNSLFYSLFMEFHSMREIFSNFYVNQLQKVWLNKMEDLIRHNLYYQELVDNNDVLFSGASSYMMLFDKSILDEEYLENYFSLEVLRNESIDINLRPIVKELDHDLLASDYDKNLRSKDEELQRFFVGYIDSISVEDMLWGMVKLKYQPRGTVNVLEKIGSDFYNLFEIEPGYSGYNVPYIFTKEGFLEIDLSPRSEELRRMLKNLKLIKPNIDVSDENLTELAHKVQNLYYDEYSDYWLEMIQKINVKGTYTFSDLSEVLDNLANRKSSVLFQFLKVVINNTYLTDAYAAQKDKDKTGDDAKKGESKDEKVRYNELDGSVIASEFLDYYEFVGVNSKLEYSSDDAVPINALMQKFGFTAQLIKATDMSPAIRNKQLFDYYSKNTQNISNLFDVEEFFTEDTPLLFTELLASLRFAVKDSVFNGIAQHIKDQWNNRIASFYQVNFANKFPFVLEADQEVKLENINRFFMIGGVWDTFVKTYITPFMVEDTTGVHLAGLDDGDSFHIPYSLYDNVSIVKEIQKVFYHDNPAQASLKLKIVPRKMSSSVKKFELDDGSGNKCSYDQGPRLPCSLQWPSSGPNPLKLSFVGSNNYGYGTTFESQWGLLKVFKDNLYSDFQDFLKNGYQSWTFTYENRTIVYDVQVTGQEDSTIPVNLFQRIDLDAW